MSATPAAFDIRLTELPTPARYIGAGVGDSVQGTIEFFAADSSLLRFGIPTIFFHEYVHHVRYSAWAGEQQVHPAVRASPSNATGEGFAHYAERLADELSMYTRPEDRLGMILAQAVRSARRAIDTCQRMVKVLRKEAGVRAQDVAIPVATAPGEVVQVDFGYVGKLLDPATMTLRKAYVFVGVMGYSRMMFAKLVFDQKVQTWVRLHVEMFEALGGVPKVVVPDNLKAAVIRAAFTAAEETTLNRSYRELGRYYGLKIDPTPPYSPQKKGKVESGVKYLKNSVLKSRDEMSIAELQDELDEFVRETANVREHGSTFRPPNELFEQERGAMRALPPQRYDPVTWHEAKVHRDCHVQFRRCRYSVPWKHVGESVWLRASSSEMIIYANDERIATHPRQDGGGKSMTNESHLPDQRSEYRQRSQSYWQQRAEQLGEEVGALSQEIWDSDDVLHQLRTVQAVVKLLAGYPPHRAKAAAKRALLYGVLDYRGVRIFLSAHSISNRYQWRHLSSARSVGRASHAESTSSWL